MTGEDPLSRAIKILAIAFAMFAVAAMPNELRGVQNETSSKTEQESDAQLQLEPYGPAPDPRVEKIRNVLGAYAPHMEVYSGVFIYFADFYDVDSFLVVSVGALESGWYQHCLGGNCFGHAGNDGYLRYPDFTVGIERATALFSMEKYREYTADSPDFKAIGQIYAEDPAWADKVESIYKIFEGGKK